MSNGNLPGRDDRPTPRNAGALGVPRLGWTALAVLLLVVSSVPAEAQRPSRRWRSAPPAPRVQTAPRAPQPSAAAAAPRTGSQQAGTQPSSPKQPAVGGKEGKQEGKTASSQDKQPGKQPGQCRMLAADGVAAKAGVMQRHPRAVLDLEMRLVANIANLTAQKALQSGRRQVKHLNLQAR